MAFLSNFLEKAYKFFEEWKYTKFFFLYTIGNLVITFYFQFSFFTFLFREVWFFFLLYFVPSFKEALDESRPEEKDHQQQLYEKAPILKMQPFLGMAFIPTLYFFIKYGAYEEFQEWGLLWASFLLLYPLLVGFEFVLVAQTHDLRKYYSFHSFSGPSHRSIHSKKMIIRYGKAVGKLLAGGVIFGEIHPRWADGDLDTRSWLANLSSYYRSGLSAGTNTELKSAHYLLREYPELKKDIVLEDGITVDFKKVKVFFAEKNMPVEKFFTADFKLKHPWQK